LLGHLGFIISSGVAAFHLSLILKDNLHSGKPFGNISLTLFSD